MTWPAALAAWLLASFLAGLGNTVGYHRLLTHRSFRARGPVRALLALLGALHSGSPMVWVAVHRLHHLRSDVEEDPHSPREGMWHAHVGWLIGTDRALPCLLFAASGFGQQGLVLLRDVRRLLGREEPPYGELVPDLNGERWMRVLDTPGVLPALFAGQLAIAAWGWGGWGIAWLWSLHLYLTNASWAVNSLCHCARFGRAPHDTGDRSRDVPWLAVATNGEAFHNSHHRYPRSARHGLDGGLDASWWTIRALCRLGLASSPWLPKRYREAAPEM